VEKLIVASNNQGKIKEIKAMLQGLSIEVLSLKDAGLDIEVDETGSTFYENAYLKAKEIYDLVKIPVLSDDSGLIIDALAGEPGVDSAIYAGPQRDNEANIDKVLDKLKMQANEQTKYSARFVCTMVLIIDEQHEYTTEGSVEGEIIMQRKGTNGFGYDPIFYLEEFGLTFAQIDSETKNKISHRAIALQKAIEIIKEKLLCH
jgi:XTP/dITP diphosphohydrolase